MKTKKLILPITVLSVGICCASFFVFSNATASANHDLLLQNIHVLAKDELPENGTCCPEQNSTCKLKDVTVVDHYLRTDGLRCNPVE